MSEELYKKTFSDFYDAALTPVELLTEERFSNKTLIAEGGVKNVFKVYDAHCSREVAMAEIKDDIFTIEQAVDFVREVQLTASLEHPNIIRIYDIGIDDAAPWFTMEYLPSKSLDTYLSENPDIALIRRLEIFLQICNAIAYAHENDVLHLDLKPSNVTMGKRDQPILCDWGISTSIATSPDEDLLKGHTLKGYIKGSVGYMAPEQTSPEYEKHPSADIYGLGGLLYFILTGEHPIPHADNEDLIEKSKQGSLRFLQRDLVQPRLFPILEKALATNPGDRYQSADDMATDVEQYINGFATEAEAASLTTQLSLFIKRHKTLVLFTSFFVATLFVATAYYIHSIKENEEQLIVEKQKAEEALENFKNEQSAHGQSRNQNMILQLNADLISLYLFDFEAALSAVRRNYANTQNRKAQYWLGFIQFILQDYEGAIENLQGIRNPHCKTLVQIAKEYQGKLKPLNIQDLKNIYDRLPAFDHIQVFVIYHCSQNYPPEQHADFLMHVITKGNNLPNLKYSYDPREKILDLRGNEDLGQLKVKFTLNTTKLGNLRPELNLLSTLPFNTVRLSNTRYNREGIQNILPDRDIRLIWN